MNFPFRSIKFSKLCLSLLILFSTGTFPGSVSVDLVPGLSVGVEFDSPKTEKVSRKNRSKAEKKKFYEPYKTLGVQFEKAYGTASAENLNNRFQFQNLELPSSVKASGSAERYRNHALLYQLFNENNKKEITDTDVVDEYKVKIGAPSFEDARLYVGDNGQKNLSLISVVDRSRTSMGSVELSHLFYEPTTNIEILKNRQALIRGLIKNEDLLINFQSNLSKASAVSGTFLGLWDAGQGLIIPRTFSEIAASKTFSTKSALEQLKTFYPKENFILNKVFSEKTLNSAAKSRTALNAHSVFQLQKECFAVVAGGILLGENLVDGYRNFGNLGGPSGKLNFQVIGKKIAGNLLEGAVGAGPAVYKKYKEYSVKKPANSTSVAGIDPSQIIPHDMVPHAKFGFNIAMVIGSSIGIWAQSIELMNKYKALRKAHSALLEIATLVDVCDKLNKEIIENEELFIPCKNREKLSSFIDAANNNDLSNLVKLLRSRAFKNEDNKFTTIYFASILRGLNLVDQIKTEFVGALEAIGEIDAYCSLASLVKENEGRANGFCFANFEEAGNSHLKIDGVWDPFIDSDVAVSNSIELGGDLQSSTAIISGPNKGGKSTFMRSTMFSVMMAQTCGIAPARSISFSPFSYIDSYVNVEDIAGGCSKFEAEAKRFLELIKNVSSLPDGKKSLIIADEMFSGTNPRDAACAGKAVLSKKIIDFNDSIWLISTHFPEIREVERTSNGKCKNYHVEVKRKPNGDFEGEGFTFKILPGETEESTAFDVMKIAGFDQVVLDEARNIRGW
jgi:hypothetical protein